MRPPERKSTTFEKVKIGEFIFGTIDNIEYDDNHKFSYKGEEKISPAIRFVFKLDGYEYPHRSRWMNFNVGEKSNLYKKYIAKLVKNAKPDMNIEMDLLKDMKIKTIWEQNNDYQNLESIYPAGDKLTITENEINEPPLPEDDFVEEITE